MLTHFKAALAPDDFDLIESLAHEIWHEHYPDIIGLEQVEYMLKKFQTSAHMQEQLAEGYAYFLIYRDQLPAGYIAYQAREDHLFLSKLYLLQKFRGQKIGKESLAFIEEQAKKLQLYKVRLTVNKENLISVKAYESAGFVNYGVAVTDIGEGFVMDDYLMEKTFNRYL